VAGWVCWWRLTVRWQSALYSPTGQAEQVIRVRSAARLRQLVLAARRDPRVYDYGYFLHREWDDPHAPRTCSRGHELPPGRAGGRVCRCGVGHWVSECFCGAVQHRPPLHEGCGGLPFDPEAGTHRW